MQREPAGIIRFCAGLGLLFAAAAAVWWGLERAEPRADWLRVEAPPRGVVGQRLPLRVHVGPLSEAAYLSADLHGGASRDTSMGCVAAGGAKAVGKAGGTFDFDLTIPPREGLRYVTGIIYLSWTGSWNDHTLMAVTGIIPVSRNPSDAGDMRLEPLRVRPESDDTMAHARPARLPRLLTAVLLLVAAVLAWRAGQPGQASDEAQGRESRWWWRLALLLAMACLWELFGLENRLGTLARALARAHDFYYPRAVFQKVVISMAVAAAAVALLLLRRTQAARRLFLACFGLYLGVSVVNLVSLHAIDRIADLSWHGLSLVQALKLGCAGMMFGGLVSAARMRPEP